MDLVPTSPWGQLHSVATVSIGNRLPWLHINCFQSPWFQCIIIKSSIFPWVSRVGEKGCMFLKKGVISRRWEGGVEKGQGWSDTPFRTMVFWNHSRPSNHSILKIGSIVFSDIVQDDSWPWYLVTDKARFLRKKIWQPKFGANRPKSRPELGFLLFSQVWFISFPWDCIQW